jgi:arginine repressor
MKRTLSTLEKEHQQLILCHQLIASRSFSSQEELRVEFQRAGYRNIGQSTISQLLKILGVVKVQNAKGKKIYALNEQSQLIPDALRPVSEMVTDVDHNPQFVVVHVMPGYGRAVGRIIDQHRLPEVLGVIASSTSVLVAPREMTELDRICRIIRRILAIKENHGSNRLP